MTTEFIEKSGQSEIRQHIGHKIVAVKHGSEYTQVGYALECEDCDEVIFSEEIGQE